MPSTSCPPHAVQHEPFLALSAQLPKTISAPSAKPLPHPAHLEGSGTLPPLERWLQCRQGLHHKKLCKHACCNWTVRRRLDATDFCTERNQSPPASGDVGGVRFARLGPPTPTAAPRRACSDSPCLRSKYGNSPASRRRRLAASASPMSAAMCVCSVHAVQCMVAAGACVRPHWRRSRPADHRGQRCCLPCCRGSVGWCVIENGECFAYSAMCLSLCIRCYFLFFAYGFVFLSLCVRSCVSFAFLIQYSSVFISPFCIRFCVSLSVGLRRQYSFCFSPSVLRVSSLSGLRCRISSSFRLRCRVFFVSLCFFVSFLRSQCRSNGLSCFLHIPCPAHVCARAPPHSPSCPLTAR